MITRCAKRRTVGILIFTVTVSAGPVWAASGPGAGQSVDLLAGQSESGELIGWKSFHEGPNVRTGDVWRLADGVLICKGSPRGYIYTEKDYGSFVLSLEWRWPPGKTPGNGGVLLWMSGTHKIWPKSFEAQINAGSAGDVWGLGYAVSGPKDRSKTIEHPQFGTLMNVKKAKAAENPPGRWNRYEIIASGNTVTLKINGQTVNQAAGLDETTGKICLTAEGDEIHFRNVRVTPTSESRADAESRSDPLWITYEGTDGPGNEKHVVLISGDEEYRSEEALPLLGKILARRHGFRCTVLFAIDPESGTIDPNNQRNIPGLEVLASADLMVIATRFRDLPDEQMRHIVDYVDSGRPIIGMRTATHAFNMKTSKTYAHYDFAGKQWKGGFGRQILGDTWLNHHGHHGRESTRGVIIEEMKDHPIVRGCEDIWGPTDVYGVRLPLPENCTPLVMGQVLDGMKPTDQPVTGKKNDPMMPIAWIRTYKGASGRTGRVFTTTMGAATDLESEGLRRLLVNAAYWCVGLEDRIPARANVEIVGAYGPSPFGFGGFKKGVKPADHALRANSAARP